MSGEELFGRDGDLAHVLRFVDNAAESGDALVLRGEPGVGKTALLDAAAAHARTAGATVLRIAGAEFDVEVSFGALGKLLQPFAGDLGRLPAVHSTALTVALGMGGPAAASQLAVSHAALTLLTEAAATGPVLLVVDDLPWIDRASAQILGFVARRLTGTRIGVLAAARTRDLPDPGGLPCRDVPALDADAAMALLGHRFPAMPARVRRRLADEAKGNPLALLELPTTLSKRQRSGAGALPAVLPLTQRLHDAFATRIAGLPDRARELLLVAALDGAGELRTLRAVAPEPGALAAAERLGLVHADHDRISFSHPLIRAAVVHEATEAARRRVHRQLAEAHRDHPGRHAWHLAEAATGADEHVASLLQKSAHANFRRGSPVHAVSELLRAAELSPTPAGRSTRLAEAAYLGTVVTGDLRDAARLLESAQQAATEPSLALALASANHLLNRDGAIDEAHRRLAAAVRAAPDPADASDKTLLEALYNLLLVSAFGGGDLKQWDELHAALARLRPRPPELLAIMQVTFADPARASASILDRLDAAITGLQHEVSPARIVRVGMAASSVDRLAPCRDALARVVDYGRDGGPIASAIEALFLLGSAAFHSGQWDDVLVRVDEGLDLCARHGYQLPAWHGRFLRALVGAARGDHAGAGAAVAELTGWAEPRNSGLVRNCALQVGTLDALGRGDFDAAYRFATSITPAGEFASHVPQALATLLDLVEAADRTGRLAEARAHAAAARDTGVGTLSPRLAFLTRVASALAAPEGEDCRLFAEALDAPGLDRWPFDLARAELYYGERLRRTKATARARASLTAAWERFERLGAEPWAARASTELRAVGTRPEQADLGDVVLTPQQRQIATLAAGGLTNKQIGEQLFLSPRTVGAHLYQLFPKLGVTSRAALRDALTTLDDG
ncbi:LuxR family transcriptional regulator fused with ATPase domain [Amycolatopsis mediterranei S699]|uniref:LuxR family transcriptional regulator fused with ATPase domain n=3 Tax=Amycolatopsis mediterranei TaxID=33910 RepID=A0A0H3DDA7_AMYMU|nr:LuxR family transcriptional regulator [Amycolatopsis mediterranei]ADJ48207.1 LuxR family transcriptional regulator fused with ATPase domain [Amycolatopsis mediterranei U32]AEK45113.1 LuxR family transcriptional regulator fused with ATPase domain [Amycolatopsis mediterranei S699]AFO79918.1 LuxR family transcriptional regulator fused with ATPase domain [Amycolatopsis mediterranei S699]AGT87046.1 LuxR family transcriptional regulator fused with ATPase domain [Amycolatopsis mediterranei RB]KDO1